MTTYSPEPIIKTLNAEGDSTGWHHFQNHFYTTFKPDGDWAGTISLEMSVDGESNPVEVDKLDTEGSIHVPVTRGGWYFRVIIRSGNYSSGSGVLTMKP